MRVTELARKERLAWRISYSFDDRTREIEERILIGRREGALVPIN
jgi:hypothetical protein